MGQTSPALSGARRELVEIDLGEPPAGGRGGEPAPVQVAALCWGAGGGGHGAGGLGARAGAALAVEVFARLCQLDRVVTGDAGRPDAGETAIRAQMGVLLTAWRRLLELHLPLGNGRCPRCRTWDGWRGRRWPCAVWTTAQSYLVGHGPPSAGSG